MTKKSQARLAKDALASKAVPAARQGWVSPAAGLHPILKNTLKEARAVQLAAQITAHQKSLNETEAAFTTNTPSNNPDDAEESNNAWDKLEELYGMCARAVVAPVVLGSLSQRKDLIAFVEDKGALTARIQMFQQDILQLKAELEQIHAQHVGREGECVDPDENMKALVIGEQYMLFQQRMAACIEPTVAGILSTFATAELLQKNDLEKQAQALLDAQPVLSPEQDPNVVTDVELKML